MNEHMVDLLRWGPDDYAVCVLALLGLLLFAREFTRDSSQANRRFAVALPLAMLLAGIGISADAVKPLDCADIEPYSMLWFAYGCWVPWG